MAPRRAPRGPKRARPAPSRRLPTGWGAPGGTAGSAPASERAIRATGVLLVANAQGELLMRGGLGEARRHALRLPARAPRGAQRHCGRGGLACAADGGGGADAARGSAGAARGPAGGGPAGLPVHVAKGEFLELFCSQGAAARALGASGGGRRAGLAVASTPARSTDRYGEPCRGGCAAACTFMAPRSRRACSTRGAPPRTPAPARWASGRRWRHCASPRTRRLAADAGAGGGHGARTRRSCRGRPFNNHEALLRRSLLLRTRARRAGRITAAQAALTAAKMARLALRAALRGQRLVGAAYRDRAAAEAKRARRAAEHAGGLRGGGGRAAQRSAGRAAQAPRAAPGAHERGASRA